MKQRPRNYRRHEGTGGFLMVAVGVAVLILWLLTGISAGQSTTAATQDANRLRPDDLVYQGAFRLPEGPEEYAWGWSGQGLAWCPDGDRVKDGYPGSLFGVGHDWHQWVSQVTIPRPVVSQEKNLDDLHTARTLQPFADIRGDLYPEMEQPRAALAYLSAQGEQQMGKLYFCWTPHLNDGDPTQPRHGWCETTLDRPQSAGLWKVGNEWNYVTSDYLFPIPGDWADRYAGGRRLATGRYRDGGQGALGPSLFAIAPWQEGNPPVPGATLKPVTLLKYSRVTDPDPHGMDGYAHSDEWSGGAWLKSGDRSAVIFVGTKGIGKTWYGYADGTVWPQSPPYPPLPEDPNAERGWWSQRFQGQMIFFDTAELAAVAEGRMEPWQPQPYATMNIDPVLYHIESDQQLRHVVACAVDPHRGLLYVLEFRGDGDKSLVHVWAFKD